MMGESGCGKTYLSQFVSQVLLEEEALRTNALLRSNGNRLRQLHEESNRGRQRNSLKWKKRLCFFDEFNTSCLQSIVAEIMLDRICPIDLEIQHIPDNIVFISCCNPYRMKTKKSDVGLVPKTTDNLLSHRVYPIPERLINFIWDFGQLSDNDEYHHLKSIIEAEKLFESEVSNFFSTDSAIMIYTAHQVRARHRGEIRCHSETSRESSPLQMVQEDSHLLRKDVLLKPKKTPTTSTLNPPSHPPWLLWFETERQTRTGHLHQESTAVCEQSARLQQVPDRDHPSAQCTFPDRPDPLRPARRPQDRRHS